MVRCPGILGLGMAANVLVPIAFIFLVSRLMSRWHNADEVQNILVGLARSVPCRSPARRLPGAKCGRRSGTQPGAGPVFYAAVAPDDPRRPPLDRTDGFGDYAEDLHELASAATGTFLLAGVFAPALVGIAVGWAVGEARLTAVRPGLKLINSIVLLLLNYSNASVSLPQAVVDPDTDFLAATLAIVAGLCVLAFGAGWLISHLIRATPSQRTSLMFGLGMNNNGTGLVLASLALADHPRVMLPVIFYNLVQHLIAGLVDRIVYRARWRRCPGQFYVHHHGFVGRALRSPGMARAGKPTWIR